MKNLRNDIVILSVLSFFGGVILTLAINNTIVSNDRYERLESIVISQTYDLDPCEYQFVAEDDSIIVTDFGRHVGKVKLEGELLDLITMDNE
jgi:hypothetical protein